MKNTRYIKIILPKDMNKQNKLLMKLATEREGGGGLLIK